MDPFDLFVFYLKSGLLGAGALSALLPGNRPYNLAKSEPNTALLS
jgi:hypothetical protein